MPDNTEYVRAPLVKVSAGRYRTQNGRYEIERNGAIWEIWQTKPSLGVYEAPTLRECAAWLWPYGGEHNDRSQEAARMAENERQDAVRLLAGTLQVWQVRALRLQTVLQTVLEERHHWCTKGQWTDTAGYLNCSCGKDRRDMMIREALRIDKES